MRIARIVIYRYSTILAILIVIGIINKIYLIPLNYSENCEFPRAWLLPVMKDNIKDTELKYFFDVLLPLAAELRTKGEQN